jgi:hypothetical protein
MRALACVRAAGMETLMIRKSHAWLASLAWLVLACAYWHPSVAAGSYSENFDDNLAQGWTAGVGGPFSATAGYYQNDVGGSHNLAFYGGDSWATGFTYTARLYNDDGASGNRVGIIFNYQDAANFYEVSFNPLGLAELRKVIGGTLTIVASGPYQGGGHFVWFEAEIVRSGANTTVRVNDVDVFTSVSQPELGAGRIGVNCRSASCRYDDVAVAPAAAVYSENFDDNLAQGWAAGVGGPFSATAGYYQNDVGGSHNLAFYGGDSWATDFTYDARLYNDDGASGNRVGVIFNYQDASNFYEVSFNPLGLAELRKVIGGTLTIVASGPYQGGGHLVWFDAQVSRSGTSTTVRVNDVDVFTSVSQPELGAGRIGVNCRSALCRYDDISVTSGSSGGGGTDVTFPKIAGILNGSPKDYDQDARQTLIAKFDLALLGIYKDWNFSDGGARPVVQQIKAKNPNILIANYTLLESLRKNPADLASLDMQQHVESAPGPNGIDDWWAYDASGNPVQHENTDLWMVNITHFVEEDENGDRWPQYYVNRQNDVLFAPVPEYDIWFTDNVFWQPREDADWNRDGTLDSSSNPTVRAYYRAAIASQWDVIRALQPSLLIMGNVDSSGTNGGLREPEYRNKIPAALYEGAMGQDWSAESRGWYAMKRNYESLIDNTTAPHLVVFQAHGLPNGTALNNPNGTPYRFLRYALTTALLENGYFAFSVNDNYHDIEWFDEFDVDLGRPIDPPQRAPRWTSGTEAGLFFRRYERGAVLMNPRTNDDGPPVTPRGPASVNLPAKGFTGYVRIAGTEDPSTNNGAAVTGSLTIAAGDGIVLLKP